MTGEAEMRRAIARKRDGEALDGEAWRGIVAAYTAGGVDDAQMAALLMACVLRGFDADETYALADAYVRSGERLLAPDPRTLDKHSSGGVADTASLIVVPLVAACGVPVAKLSGRALGHTGGTLDKLEAIPGVRTDLAPERFAAIVGEVGCAIAAQSARLVPADGRIYGLRDRTGTVPSLGLVAASIVAKKIAGGARAIVYDVKRGRGAFMRETADARALAATLVALTARFGVPSRALVTDMDEPLGRAIGTGLEAIEARDFLRGDARDARLGAVCDALARAMLEQAGFAPGDAASAVARALASGEAYARFEAMLAAQGAAPGALAALAPLGEPAVARAPQSGIVTAIDAVALGELARGLTDAHGGLAGLRTRARAGDAVRAGDALADVHGDASLVRDVARAFAIGEVAVEPRALVLAGAA